MNRKALERIRQIMSGGFFLEIKMALIHSFRASIKKIKEEFIMKTKNLDESKKRNKKGLLLLKQILSPDEYRDITGLPVIESDKSATCLLYTSRSQTTP